MIFGGFIEVQVRKGLKLGFPRFWAGFNPFLAKLYLGMFEFWALGGEGSIIGSKFESGRTSQVWNCSKFSFVKLGLFKIQSLWD